MVLVRGLSEGGSEGRQRPDLGVSEDHENRWPCVVAHSLHVLALLKEVAAQLASINLPQIHSSDLAAVTPLSPPSRPRSNITSFKILYSQTPSQGP